VTRKLSRSSISSPREPRAPAQLTSSSLPAVSSRSSR
jgi:hypothetical protein